MLIKSIKLNNIRSYASNEINFGLGSTLLSGDIGSGKSTILLAMDFALFGLSKGIITGEALLRHGQKEGSVELNFVIDDKNIKIKRNLKRTSGSVAQDPGYLMINNEKENLSPVELKQRVLQILNYPQETLTKKSLIYRYTVYTPQEEMKSILSGDEELRLDTLRKIFNIDKYKRIKENIKILSSEIKLRIKEHELLAADLEYLKRSKEEKIKNSKELNEKLLRANEILADTQKRIRIKKEEISKIEEKIKTLNEYKKDLEVNEINLKNSLKRINENSETLIILKKETEDYEKEDLKEIDADKVHSNILNYKNKLGKTEEELLGARKSLNECKHDFINSEKLVRNIKDLEKCPTCFQDVNDEHKQSIINNEEMKLRYLRENIGIYTKKENEFIKDIRIINQEIEKLNELKSRNEIISLKLKRLNEKKERYNKITDENKELKELTSIIEKRKLELSSKINEFSSLNYDELKKELEFILNEEKNALLTKNSHENDIRNIESDLSILDENITKKETARGRLFKAKNLKNFIEFDFMNLIETIEKKIMLRVHNDFNELFVKWFNILVDDENINVKLNEEFSPVIEQNGYNIDFLFLSGGEKTAGALAYRLALNQVINNLISHIKTKDLLILDEPTDGFSEDQLDRVRLVLDELDIKQVILVSHESKIESFVNNVIRLNKRDGVSEVL